MAGGWWWLWLLIQWAGPIEGDLAQELQAIVAETPWVEVNTAPVADLMALPWMTPDLAWSILQERQRTPFTDFEDFACRVPLDPLQTYVYARVLRFPRRRSTSVVHGSAWVRWDRAGQGRGAFRIMGRWPWGRLGFHGPDPRGYLVLRRSSAELWLGTLRPRWGLDLLTGGERTRRLPLGRSARWRTGRGPLAAGLRVRRGQHALWIWWAERSTGFRWEPARRVAVNWTPEGATMDARFGSPTLRVSLEGGWVKDRWQARGRLRVRAGESRWALGWDSQGPLTLQGQVPLSPGVALHLGSWADSTGLETRITGQWQWPDLWVQVGMRSRQREGDPHRLQWFVDLQNPDLGSRVHLERVDRAGRTGWLMFLERRWQGRRLAMRIRWAVYRVSSWYERLWLAEGAPGLWPRVYTLTGPGYRGTVAWSWRLWNTWHLVGWVSVAEDLRQHVWVPEACLALRW